MNPLVLLFQSKIPVFRVSEYPPDANHGHYIPSAVVSFVAADELWYKNRSSLGDPLLTAFDELVFPANLIESSECVKFF